MKQLLIIALSSILFTSCATVIFTTKPDLGERHHGKIPAEWQGRWQNASEPEFLISSDSISANLFSFNLSDTLKNSAIYIKNNYFLIEEAMADTSTFKITMGKLNENGEIECWQMNYAYFLDHQLITSVRAYQYDIDSLMLKTKVTELFLPFSKNEGTGGEEDNMNFKLSKQKLKKIYKASIKELWLKPEYSPLLTSYSFDFEFFIKYSKDVKPDFVLLKDKTVKNYKKSRSEKKYERMFEKAQIKDYMRFLKTEL